MMTEGSGSRRYLAKTLLLAIAGAALAGPTWGEKAAKPVQLRELLGKPVSAYVKAYGKFKKTSTDDGTTTWTFTPPKHTVSLSKSPETGTRVMVEFSLKGIEVEAALRQVGFESKGVKLLPIGEGILDTDGTQLGMSYKLDGIAKVPAGFEDVQWTKMEDSPSFLFFGPRASGH